MTFDEWYKQERRAHETPEIAEAAQAVSYSPECLESAKMLMRREVSLDPETFLRYTADRRSKPIQEITLMTSAWIEGGGNLTALVRRARELRREPGIQEYLTMLKEHTRVHTGQQNDTWAAVELSSRWQVYQLQQELKGS